MVYNIYKQLKCTKLGPLKCDGTASLGNVNRVSVEYIASKPPLVGEHAFPSTGFAVAWFGCSLQKYYTL